MATELRTNVESEREEQPTTVADVNQVEMYFEFSIEWFPGDLET